MDEPFVITCETCGSRLRVRSAAAIGSILACPKCQSLVHVLPPADRAEAAPTTDDLEKAPLSDSVPASLLPAKLAVAAVCLTAVIGVGLIFGFDPSSDADSELDANAADSVAARNDALLADTDVADSDEEAEIGAAEANAPTHDGNAGATRPTNVPDEPARPPALPPPPAGDSVAAAAAPPQDASGTGTVPPLGIPQFDFGFDAAPDATGHNVPQRPPVAIADPAPDDPQRLPQAEVAPPAASPSSAVRMTIARVNGGNAANRAGAGIDPVDRLSLPVVGLSLKETSAIEFVRLIGDLTGTTITVTPPAYLALQRAAAGDASLTQTDTTAGGALSAVLTLYDLRFDRKGDHLSVVPVDSAASNSAADGDANGAWSGASPDALQQAITFSFTTPTPLEEVLRHVERISGLTILVDWRSLADRQLGPASLVTASVVDQPLGDVLDKLLPQLETRWAPLGADAIWVTAESP